jgi:hypothetical protein
VPNSVRRNTYDEYYVYIAVNLLISKDINIIRCIYMKSLVLLTMRILATFFFPALLAWAVYHDKIIIDYILIVCTAVILSLFLLNDKINNILERVSTINKEGVSFQNNSNVLNSHNEKSLKETEDTSKEILNHLSDSKNILEIEKELAL